MPRFPCSRCSFEGFFQGQAPNEAANTLDVTIVPNEATQSAECYQLCSQILDAERPDTVITYGGDQLADGLMVRTF